MEKDRAEVMAENKRLLEPLREAKEQVDLLKKQLANYEKDKETLRVGFRSFWRLSVYVIWKQYICTLNFQQALLSNLFGYNDSTKLLP